MYKRFTRNLTLSLALCLTVATSPAVVSAEISDFDQEVIIKSESQDGDLKKKIFSYIDNVVITQGSLVINADLVQVITTADAKEKVYIAKGSPAKFSRTLADGTPINLQANEIKYDPANSLITISGDAYLEQDGTQMTGDTITYNFRTEQVNASSEDNAQVETVLQPQHLEKKKK